MSNTNISGGDRSPRRLLKSNKKLEAGLLLNEKQPEGKFARFLMEQKTERTLYDPVLAMSNNLSARTQASIKEVKKHLLLRKLVTLFGVNTISKENKVVLENLIKSSHTFKEKANSIEPMTLDDLMQIRLDVQLNPEFIKNATDKELKDLPRNKLIEYYEQALGMPVKSSLDNEKLLIALKECINNPLDINILIKLRGFYDEKKIIGNFVECCERIIQLPGLSPKKQSIELTWLADFYDEHKMIEKGIECFERILVIPGIDPSYKLDAFIGLSKIYENQQDIVKALDYLNQGLEIPELNSINQVDALSHLADFYERQGDSTKTIESLERALNLPDISSSDQINTLTKLANFYERQENSTKAIESLERALNLSILNPNKEINVLTKLATLYNDLGETEKSTEYHEKIIILERIILRSNISKNIYSLNQYNSNILTLNKSEKYKDILNKEELKRLVIEKSQQINEEISKKVKIICLRELNIETLQTLASYLDILISDPDDQKTKEIIDKLFCPELTIGMENIPIGYRAEIFINERAKFIAKLLINNIENIDEIINLIKDLLNTPPFMQKSSKIHDTILLKTLECIRDNQQFIDLLNDLEEPGKNLNKWDPNKPYIESLIRATLSLDENTPLTAMHSKLALLSALLTDLRQSDVGSCFATSIAIMVHDQDPLQAAIELKQIIENGKFQKIIDGKTQTFNIPKLSIPKALLEESEVNYFEVIPFTRFLENPGIQKTMTMAGLDIDNKEDLKKFLIIFNNTLKSLSDPKKHKDVIRGIMQQLAMYKNGLDIRDFENRTKYEQQALQKEKLEKKLEKAQTSEKQTLILNQIETIQKNIDELNSYFDKKFGVGVSLKNKFEACDEFKQTLELHYHAARGENTLLRIWEYSIAFKGRPEIMELLTNTLTYTRPKGVWEPFKPYASVFCILDQILNETEDKNNTFDKIQFKNEFNRNFKDLLTKRLEIRYEGDSFKLYDKTKAISMDLAVPLEDPAAICDAIASIAYDAAENIRVNNSKIKDKIITQLCSDLEKPGFFTNMINALGGTGNDMASFGRAVAVGKIQGGHQMSILENYIENPFEAHIIGIGGDPITFIIEIVGWLNLMIRKGVLSNIDLEHEIMLPISYYKDKALGSHAFLFRPDMAMLVEIMKNPDPEVIKTWFQKKLIEEKQTFIVGDFNWERNGSHLLQAIKYDSINNRLSFFRIKESGEVEVAENFSHFMVYFIRQ